MSQNAIRIAAVGIAIAAVAIVSVATETKPRPASTDPSVPAAWQVLHANDGREQGNVDDKTY
jgi:invasion protein IalB